MRSISNDVLYKIIGIIIISVMLFICFRYASGQSFWVDELDWTIDYLAGSNNIIELFQNLIKGGFNLPLYYIAMFPIYKIAPFGEIWLLIPNFIAIVFGIYFIYKTGNKIGKNLGFASLCLAATSFTLIDHCAFEFRPYTFLFCFSAYALYRYVYKLQDSKKLSNMVLYTLSIILLAYTHWFGCLIIVFYFLSDVVFWLKKKLALSFILPYITLGIAFLPYFITMMLNHTTNFADYGAIPPTIDILFYTIFCYLLSNSFICKILFVIGFFILLACIFRKTKAKYTSKSYVFILIGGIIWTLGTIFIYSRFINPNTSFWVPRYFIVIIPYIFIIASIPISRLLSFSETINMKNIISLKDGKTYKFPIKKVLIICIIMFLVFIIACVNYRKVHESSTSIFEPYREVSSLIANSPGIYEDNCALITSCGKGYFTYYFDKQGLQLPNTAFETPVDTVFTQSKIVKQISDGKIVNNIDASYEDLLKYDKLYLFQVHESFKKEFLNYLHDYYDLSVINQKLGYYLFTKKTS